jgi:hypothetical protein
LLNRRGIREVRENIVAKIGEKIEEEVVKARGDNYF